MKTAVLGDWESIQGFGVLGFVLYPVEGEAEIRSAWEQLRETDCGLVLVTEPAAQLLDGQEGPVRLRIPSLTGEKTGAMQRLHALVRKAAGSDIGLGGDS